MASWMYNRCLFKRAEFVKHFFNRELDVLIVLLSSKEDLFNVSVPKESYSERGFLIARSTTKSPLPRSSLQGNFLDYWYQPAPGILPSPQSTHPYLHPRN